MSRDDPVLLIVKRLEVVAEKLTAIVKAQSVPKRMNELSRLQKSNIDLRAKSKELKRQLKEAHKFLHGK